MKLKEQLGKILKSTSKDIIQKLQDEAKKSLDRADTIILCGMTPFAQKVLQKKELLGQNKKVFGIDDAAEANKYLGGNILYILCTRRLQKYLEVLPELGGSIIQYQLLLSLFPELSSEPYVYTYENIKEQIEDILLNVDKYREIFDNLSDEKSKEIFIKILLFRLTYDYRLHMNNANNYPHYFEQDLFQLSDEEVFIDGGGYIGDTLEQFRKLTSGKFKEYHLFEPDEKLIEKIDCGDDKRIFLHNAGLWKQTTELQFKTQTGLGNGTIIESADDSQNLIKLQVVSLDEIIDLATFIKLDVEGSELAALQGAKKIIKRCTPKLAVCTYHKQQDLRELYDEIAQYGEYDFYLRTEMDNLAQEHYYICLPHVEKHLSGFVLL